MDLSLAQIASLGAAIAVWQGYDPHDSSAIYWMSLAFTLIGAVIFAVIKGHEAQDPAGSLHRHLLCRRFRGGHPDAQQSDGRGRASSRHARRQHPVGAVAGSVADRRHLRRDRIVPLRVQATLPGNLDGLTRGGGAGRLGALLGLSVLRLVRPGRDAFRRDSRRAAGVLLPDRPLGGGDAVLVDGSDRGLPSAG